MELHVFFIKFFHYQANREDRLTQSYVSSFTLLSEVWDKPCTDSGYKELQWKFQHLTTNVGKLRVTLQ